MAGFLIQLKWKFQYSLFQFLNHIGFWHMTLESSDPSWLNAETRHIWMHWPMTLECSDPSHLNALTHHTWMLWLFTLEYISHWSFKWFYLTLHHVKRTIFIILFDLIELIKDYLRQTAIYLTIRIHTNKNYNFVYHENQYRYQKKIE